MRKPFFTTRNVFAWKTVRKEKKLLTVDFDFSNPGLFELMECS